MLRLSAGVIKLLLSSLIKKGKNEETKIVFKYPKLEMSALLVDEEL